MYSLGQVSLLFVSGQVTKNRFDGVLGRIPLEFVRESLSMSGYGKTPQPKKPTVKLDRPTRPDKLKVTRLGADVDIVKFSAPKMFGTNKNIHRKAILPAAKPTSTNIDGQTLGAVTQDAKDNTEQENELNNAFQERNNTPHVMSAEKKENVQKTVKKILSGTRLFTKAVNASRIGNGRPERDQVIRKPHNEKLQK